MYVLPHLLITNALTDHYIQVYIVDVRKYFFVS